MALDRVPDMARKAAEIDDPALLVHRLLYRQGRMWLMLDEEEVRPRGERASFLRAITESNRADLRRIEELVAAGRRRSTRSIPTFTREGGPATVGFKPEAPEVDEAPVMRDFDDRFSTGRDEAPRPIEPVLPEWVRRSEELADATKEPPAHGAREPADAGSVSPAVGEAVAQPGDAAEPDARLSSTTGEDVPARSRLSDYLPTPDAAAVSDLEPAPPSFETAFPSGFSPAVEEAVAQPGDAAEAAMAETPSTRDEDMSAEPVLHAVFSAHEEAVAGPDVEPAPPSLETAFPSGFSPAVEEAVAQPGDAAEAAVAETPSTSEKEVPAEPVLGHVFSAPEEAVAEPEVVPGSSVEAASPAANPDVSDAGAERALVLADRELAHLETAAGVVESLNLGFHLGSAVERIAAAAGQGSAGVPALRQAAWLLERYMALLERRPLGADLHVSAVRLARTGDAIAELRGLAAALEAEPAFQDRVDEQPRADESPETPPAPEPGRIRRHLLSRRTRFS